MNRGSQIDLTILGAMENSERGDIASWMIPGKVILGMSGLMDLVASVKKIIVAMEHRFRNSDPKFVKACSLPIAGAAVVDMLITDPCVFNRPARAGPFKLIEPAAGVTATMVREYTGAGYGDSDISAETQSLNF